MSDHITSREISEYTDTESELCEKAENYEHRDHPNGKLARTFLVATYNLGVLKQSLEVKPELGEHVQAKHKFQHLLTHTSIQAFYAQYRVLKHHRYLASYRQLRYIYQSHLTIQGLNEEKEVAAEEWQNWKKSSTP